MAKLYGLFGSMTGKLGETVMSVRNGEQLVRRYQPNVFNPSTPAQVAQRAKLKLLSQMSAVMAPVIAMPRQGSVSSRNRFSKVNFPALTYADNTASVNLTAIKLTNSVVALPPLSAAFGDNTIAVSLSDTASLNVNRVVYVAFRKMADESLRLAGSLVVSVAGADNTYAGSLPVETVYANYVIYAYGVRDNTENARVAFGDMNVPTALSVAKLIVTRTLSETDITVTETVAAEVNQSNAKAEEDNSPKKSKK